MKVSVIIPVYNEKKTIRYIIEKITKLKKITSQIILVDDNSTDGTKEIIKKNIQSKVDTVIFKNKNCGKGAAIRTARSKIKEEIVIIQDGDLEYDPRDYFKLINPIKKGLSEVVYGSRVLNKDRYKNTNFTSKFRVFANHMLTIFSNIINGQSLTDAHTCYKVFKKSRFNKLKLNENRFGFCPEVTSQLSQQNIKIIEVPIRYKGRTFQQGKKISFKDGFRIIYVILKYKLFY